MRQCADERVLYSVRYMLSGSVVVSGSTRNYVDGVVLAETLRLW